MAKKASNNPSPQPAGNQRKVTFSITAPTAMSVLLVGDFTQWQEKPISLAKQEGGAWSVVVELAPGAHHYRFLVDGEWRDDPECTLSMTNPYGSANAVREVV